MGDLAGSADTAGQVINQFYICLNLDQLDFNAIIKAHFQMSIQKCLLFFSEKFVFIKYHANIQGK